MARVGGNSKSYDPGVFRIPRHVNTPRGPIHPKKSVTSRCNDLGDILPCCLFASAWNISIIWGVSFVRLSVTSSVSSCFARQGRGRQIIGNFYRQNQRLITRHTCTKRLKNVGLRIYLFQIVTAWIALKHVFYAVNVKIILILIGVVRGNQNQ